MTSLIRCRGSSSEIAARFAAEADAGLMWRPAIWPGEPVLVVLIEQDRRRLRTMRWGLPATALSRPTPLAQSGTMFARDLVEGGKLTAPQALARCLIVVEAFAYPDGELGRRTRTWSGLWDVPLCGWLGLCVAGGEHQGCAGLLTTANPLIETVSRHMPRLLPPADSAAWLEPNAGLFSLPQGYDEGDFYLEPTDELWSTGTPSKDSGA